MVCFIIGGNRHAWIHVFPCNDNSNLIVHGLIQLIYV